METSSDLKERIQQIATCAICMEDFKKPKILPCIHTFCLQCLEGHCKDKEPQDKVPCPLCRTEFILPTDGPSALRNNFFVQELVEAKQLSSVDAHDVMCESCSSVGADDTIRKATVFCVDCSQKLCEPCSKPHRTMRGGPHRIHTLGSEMKTEFIQLRGRYCEKHTDKLLELYCSECNVNVCLMCVVINHKSHDCKEIGKVATEFLKQINTDMESVGQRRSEMAGRIRQLEIDKVNFLTEVQKSKTAVQQRGDFVKSIISRQASDIVQKLDSMSVATLKDVAARNDDLSSVLTEIESFAAYCKEMTSIGRPSDVTHAANDLHGRASELLKKACVVPEDVYVGLQPITFVPVDIEELVDSEQTFVGVLQRKKITDFQGQELIHIQTPREKKLHKILEENLQNEEAMETHLRMLNEQLKQASENEQKQQREFTGQVQLIEQQLNQALERENESQKQLDKANQKAFVLTTKLQVMSDRESNLQCGLKRAEENISRLTEELNEKQTALHHVTEREGDLHTQLQDEIRREDELKRNLMTLTKVQQEIQKQLDEAQTHANQAINEKQSLQEDLDQTKDELRQLQEKLATAESCGGAQSLERPPSDDVELGSEIIFFKEKPPLTAVKWQQYFIERIKLYHFIDVHDRRTGKSAYLAVEQAYWDRFSKMIKDYEPYQGKARGVVTVTSDFRYGESTDKSVRFLVMGDKSDYIYQHRFVTAYQTFKYPDISAGTNIFSEAAKAYIGCPLHEF